MTGRKYTIRNLENGDEEIIAKIFNQVIPDIDSDFPKFNAQEIKHHQPIYGSIRNLDNYDPADIKFLVSEEDEEVGYVESSNQFNRYTIHYPMIITTHRTPKSLNFLFNALYDSILNQEPKSIRAVYNCKYEKIHDFFRNQFEGSAAKITEIHQNKRFSIPVNNLTHPSDDITTQPFTIDDIDTLLEFRNLTKGVIGSEISKQSLVDGFEEGKYSTNNSFLLKKRNLLVGWVSARINTPPHDYDKSLKHSVGLLNKYILNLQLCDLNSLRKAMFGAVKQYFIKKKISEFRIWTKVSDDINSFYQNSKDYGFLFTGECEYGYDFSVE